MPHCLSKHPSNSAAVIIRVRNRVSRLRIGIRFDFYCHLNTKVLCELESDVIILLL